MVWLLFCVIDIYSKYAWVCSLKNKKGITIINAIQTILHESEGWKRNKLWKGKGGVLYNIKPCLQDNNIEIKLTYNERDLVVAERFVRTLKNKVDK